MELLCFCWSVGRGRCRQADAVWLPRNETKRSSSALWIHLFRVWPRFWKPKEITSTDIFQVELWGSWDCYRYVMVERGVTPCSFNQRLLIYQSFLKRSLSLWSDRQTNNKVMCAVRHIITRDRQDDGGGDGDDYDDVKKIVIIDIE